jgi:hypothetical protein
MPDAFFPPEFYSPGLWFADPRGTTLAPFYLVLGALFALLLVGGLLAYAFAPRLAKQHRLRADLLRRLTTALAIVGAFGCFWILARSLAIPLFARPLWLWLTLFALVAVVAYALQYWRTRYPAEMRAWAERERRRRWMPAPRKRTGGRRR